MKIIKSVEVIHVNGDVGRVDHGDKPCYLLGPDGGKELSELEYMIRSETIYGKTFVTKGGGRVIIGLSEQAKKHIGVIFDAFDGMNEEIYRLARELANIRKRECQASEKVEMYEEELEAYGERMERYQSLSLGKKIKWLFSKKDPVTEEQPEES